VEGSTNNGWVGDQWNVPLALPTVFGRHNSQKQVKTVSEWRNSILGQKYFLQKQLQLSTEWRKWPQWRSKSRTTWGSPTWFRFSRTLWTSSCLSRHNLGLSQTRRIRKFASSWRAHWWVHRRNCTWWISRHDGREICNTYLHNVVRGEMLRTSILTT